jgi:hypothetical protein
MAKDYTSKLAFECAANLRNMDCKPGQYSVLCNAAGLIEIQAERIRLLEAQLSDARRFSPPGVR